MDSRPNRVDGVRVEVAGLLTSKNSPGWLDELRPLGQGVAQKFLDRPAHPACSRQSAEGGPRIAEAPECLGIFPFAVCDVPRKGSQVSLRAGSSKVLLFKGPVPIPLI